MLVLADRLFRKVTLRTLRYFQREKKVLEQSISKAADKVTLKRIREMTFVNAKEILGIIYSSKSGNTRLKWRQTRKKIGKVQGDASSNALVNMVESGVLTQEWVDNYLRASHSRKTSQNIDQPLPSAPWCCCRTYHFSFNTIIIIPQLLNLSLPRLRLQRILRLPIANKYPTVVNQDINPLDRDDCSMIVKEVKGSEGKAYFLIPQDADDLFIIRRILSRDDLVVAGTTRVIKQEKKYSRPDRGRANQRQSVASS